MCFFNVENFLMLFFVIFFTFFNVVEQSEKYLYIA